MSDETIKICGRTWDRNIDSINKGISFPEKHSKVPEYTNTGGDHLSSGIATHLDDLKWLVQFKVGYSDGVVAGQTASFQSSFDMGYEQGFKFGFDLGFKKADNILTNKATEDKLLDQRKINCQICLNNNAINDSIVNLYNRQLEENKNYLLA